MGYCMNQLDAQFRMTRKDAKKALQAMKRLVGKESIKDGSGPHFSWVLASFATQPTFQKCIRDWRWEVSEDSEGNIVEIQFCGEKLGDDLTLFETIAPFVEKGSYIEMNGEDGCRWRWFFDGKSCIEQHGKVQYE